MSDDAEDIAARRTSWMATRAPLYSPPGTLTVDSSASKPSIRVIAFGPDQYVDQIIDDPMQIRQYLHALSVTWVNVDGLGDVRTIEALGEIFGLHKLALEDVVHVGQRAKVDDFAQNLFIVAPMIDWKDGKLGTEQLSMFLGSDFVLTLQERPGDCLDAIRRRAGNVHGRVRELTADYLAYAILDAVMDEYFPVLEGDGDKLERLELDVLKNPSQRTVARVHEIKRDLLVLRRAIWPMREAVSSLYRTTSTLIRAETRPYFRDCYDHTVQILDLIEIYRELSTGLVEMYMTSVSNRMNEVIKVLTILSTIFMPLTFIAGLYGMNFKHMPEIEWRWGYAWSLVLMALTVVAMLVYFWHKGWLFSTSREDRRGLRRRTTRDPTSQKTRR